MTIVFINPNSTQAMTRAMLASARAAVPGAAFEGWTSTGGPAAIEGPQDGDRAVPPLLHLVQKASDDGAAAIVIGCFDDTGLAEARALAACPVIGIGQAAYHLAALAGARFSVVTTLSVSVPILENNIRSYGLSGALVRVRASGVRVLDLEDNPAEAAPRVLAEMRRAVEMDGVESVVLGCAGMVTLLETARAEMPVNVIDGVEAAARLAWALSMVRQ
ncbi:MULTISPECIES: aspartate/glutamate racemase family protein [Actibacterium]|uniref:Allantoin racemase n=1 Tax=Actibacterium naphthalenivorans TaxID=1614693 RepID=A0A840CJV5_9RHOB|nr:MULTISPECIES: aspartate/glutamate racemase family protein [Actibacterium]ALG91057.1 HyuE hydantoin racemase [Actibacterium sp. EMB200-NS6]MBB4023459.1 allantoin racemase [Actibacterium naphthalenivorans]